MADIKKVTRVTSKDLQIGSAVEQREHKWASPEIARKIAKDHLKENPNAYSGNCSSNQTVTVKVKAVRPKKKVPPPPPSNAPPFLQSNYRIWG